MEPVIAFVLIVGTLIWDNETNKNDEDIPVISEIKQVEPINSERVEEVTEGKEDVFYLGYKIKDLSISKEIEGCHRPLLTTDLSTAVGEKGKRSVNEVKISCES